MILFDGVDLESTFGCDVVNWFLEMPNIRTKFVTVPNRHGLLDFSEAYGGVRYDNRELRINLLYIQGNSTKEKPYDLLKRLSQAVHGRQVQIVLPNRPDEELEGRVQMDYQIGARYLDVDLIVDCQPLFEKIEPTVHDYELSASGNDTHILNLEGIELVPEVTVSNTCKITLRNRSVSLSAGTWTVPDLLLKPEGNEIRLEAIAGTDVSFRYIERSI